MLTSIDAPGIVPAISAYAHGELIVAGLAHPDCKVEIEVAAAG